MSTPEGGTACRVTRRRPPARGRPLAGRRPRAGDSGLSGRGRWSGEDCRRDPDPDRRLLPTTAPSRHASLSRHVLKPLPGHPGQTGQEVISCFEPSRLPWSWPCWWPICRAAPAVPNDDARHCPRAEPAGLRAAAGRHRAGEGDGTAGLDRAAAGAVVHRRRRRSQARLARFETLTLDSADDRREITPARRWQNAAAASNRTSRPGTRVRSRRPCRRRTRAPAPVHR